MSKKTKTSKKKRPTLSLSTIVRDEADSLPTCLESVKGLVDEIVLVDTGSKDNTIEVARSFGARVISKTWQDDFAAARNAGLEIATGDWILWLDADETIPEEDHEALRKALFSTTHFSFWVRFVRVSYSAPVLRVFRNLPDHRFEGRIHEQLRRLRDRASAPLDVRVVEHDVGRNSPDREDRTQRNVRLLGKALEDEPDNHFLLYHLGDEYSRLNRDQDAYSAYGRAYERLSDPDSWHAPCLIRNLALCLFRLGRHEATLGLLGHHIPTYPDFTDLHFYKGCVQMERGEFKEAIESFSTCLEMGPAPFRYPSSEGTGGRLALLQLAETYSRSGQKTQAIAAFRRLLAEEPSHPEAIVKLTRLLADTLGADQARSEMKEMTGGLTPDVYAHLERLLSDLERPERGT